MAPDTPRVRREPGNPAPASTAEIEELDYLCVEPFLATLPGARVLETAFEIGLVDRLAVAPAAPEDLARALGLDAPGFSLVQALLTAAGVVESGADGLGLTDAFRHALRYRDLLEMKLAYTEFVLPDFTGRFTLAARDPRAFARQARTFRLFAYDRALGHEPADHDATRQWMRVTTVLTRYEAPVCLRRYDVARHRRMLDIGGNSGEFALQVCRRHAGIAATVLDLPAVCEIGRAHVRRDPAGERVTFVQGSALTDVLPDGHDLVTFKSMLHDWPDADAVRLLERAAAALAPGGTMLIFERGPVPLDRGLPAYSLIPWVLFFRSFRGPALYVATLERLGFTDVRVERVELEMPFSLVTGRKP